MARANVFPTYIPELDYQILEDTNDEDLLRSCKTNTYLANLCDDEIFWRNRTRVRYSMLVKFKEPTTTWKTFYIRLVNDTIYLVEGPDGDVSMYRNITKAYYQLEIIVSNPAFLQLNQYAKIKLAYKGQVSIKDNPLLFDTRRPSTDILQYPKLSGLKLKNTLFYYSSTRLKVVTDLLTGRTDNLPDPPNDEFYGIYDYTPEVLHTFMTYVPEPVNYRHTYVNRYYELVLDAPISWYKMLFNFKYGYISRILESARLGTSSATCLINESLFGKPLKFKEISVKTAIGYSHEQVTAIFEQQIELYYTNK